ncbi:hypothetical protein TIFTF001_002333 [Ficus carica]|uniref:Uncharacterized protein n=1 Tax=Ficus carica TaxID=3494 RepID=A0AA88CS10_FICCA|nr:hypothetical protein TIFTF001_002333 [Ficus carica]
MASDFAEAFRAMVMLVFVGFWGFFIWQVVVMILLNTPDGDPTLKELIMSFFRRKRTRRPQPSDHHQENNHREPPPSDLV